MFKVIQSKPLLWIPEHDLGQDEKILSRGAWLKDKIIDVALTLLKETNPAVAGFQQVCLG